MEMGMEQHIAWTICIGHVVLLKGSLASAQSPVEEALLVLPLFLVPLWSIRTTQTVSKTRWPQTLVTLFR